jgi:tryptophan-rich sensory protein
MKNWHKALVSIIGCEAVGLLGTPFTLNAIPDWYMYLNKPLFAPPNWLFGPAWTLLYFLMGVAIYRIWIMKPSKKTKEAINYFIAQLSLNFIWTPIFFGLRSPVIGLAVIISMWFMILFTIKKFVSVDKLAGYLLLPYLAWVTFATMLNAAIVILN